MNAAGPWAGVLAATAGVDLPLEPIPRHVLVTGPFPGAPERRTLVIDAATSFYFHREGAGVLMGMGSGSERASFETAIDDTFIADELLPTAVRVFPPLEAASVEHAWVGLYEMTPDRHPIIGEAPGVAGFYLANGFSGHGFQHAPVVGKLLAELIVGGAATTVDVCEPRPRPVRTRRSRPRGPRRLSAGRGIRTLKGRSPRVFETRAVTRFRHPGAAPSLGAQVFGPTKESSATTSARRAIEISSGLGFVGRTPTESHASRKIRRMSSDRLEKRYLG